MTREGPKMVAFCFVRIDIEIDQDGHFFSEIAKKRSIFADSRPAISKRSIGGGFFRTISISDKKYSLNGDQLCISYVEKAPRRRKTTTPILYA